jgi:hypothetical protein
MVAGVAAAAVVGPLAVLLAIATVRRRRTGRAVR